MAQFHKFCLFLLFHSIGYFNDVICCEMTEDARKRLCTKKTDCSAVVVKFLSHSECHNQRFKHEPWERAVIDSFISNHDLCPRLLYISDNCQVNEYIEVCSPKTSTTINS